MRYSTLALFLTASALAQPPGIVTKAYDNARSGMWPHESILTQASVAQKGLVLERTIPVYGDARGMEAQPLIAPGIVNVTKGTYSNDVMVLPSMANVVRGVDAETGAALWSTTLWSPIQGPAKTPKNPNGIDFHTINDKWGCLSTGVIVGQKWYGVCWASTDGSGTPESGRYRMFSIDLATGNPGQSVDMQGADTSMWKMRSALAYDAKSNTIFAAHGSVYETGGGDKNGYTGGITAFDVATNTVAAQLPMSSGIWMAGQGIVIGPDGYLYAITGNGAFDPSKGWYGESFIKVRYANKTLSIVDQWSPWSDRQRTGQTTASAPKMAGMSAPSEAVKPVGGGMSMPLADARVEAAMSAQGQVVSRVYPTMAQGAWSDEDWGSAGPACIFSIQVCIATGKDGIGYAIKSGTLGGTNAASVGTAANYGRLAAPCAWLTMSPGNIPCDPADPRTLNFLPNGVSAHLHATPVQMYDPILKSWVIFVWGENAQLHKWKVGNDGRLTYVAQSSEFASADVRGRLPGGMPGGFCSASSGSDTANTALLFCSIPYGDANATITQGRFLVYDPIHLNADGSLKVLWDSQRWGIPYTFNKFMAPTVWNGRVYLPNYNGGVMVFGLGQ